MAAETKKNLVDEHGWAPVLGDLTGKTIEAIGYGIGASARGLFVNLPYGIYRGGKALKQKS